MLHGHEVHTSCDSVETNSMTFFYTYILLSKKDNKLYIGSTANLKKRYKRHQDGAVPATKHRRPLELIYYEAHRSHIDALRREKYFKTTKGKATLKTMLQDFNNSKILDTNVWRSLAPNPQNSLIVFDLFI